METDTINDLTYQINAICFKIQNVLGNSLHERYYQRALAIELEAAKIEFEQEKELQLRYEGRLIGKHRFDFLIENRLVLELKTVPILSSKDKQQLFMYLRSIRIKWGLLLNFRSKRVQIHRIVLPDRYL